MQKLHEDYVAYTLCVYGGDKEMCRDYQEFVAWWESLPDAIRENLERKYRKGYSQTIKEGAEAVRCAQLGGSNVGTPPG